MNSEHIEADAGVKGASEPSGSQTATHQPFRDAISVLVDILFLCLWVSILSVTTIAVAHFSERELHAEPLWVSKTVRILIVIFSVLSVLPLLVHLVATRLRRWREEERMDAQRIRRNTAGIELQMARLHAELDELQQRVDSVKTISVP